MRLGCADSYIVEFSTFDGKKIGETDLASSVAWNRKLDEYSTASVVMDLGATVDSKSCCDLLNLLNVRKDVVSLWRITGSDSSMVWTGPIQKITSTRGNASIQCVDKFALYETRILRDNHDDIGEDLANIWNSYLADANSVDPIITDLCPLTGILLDRTVNQDERPIAMPLLRDLLTAGLDITIHRGQIVYGAKEIRMQRMALRDDHFIGEIQVVQDGFKIASQVYAKGEGDDVVDFPNPSTSPNVGFYGLVERVYSDSNMSGTASLTETAESIYAQLANQKPFYIDMSGDSALSPNTPVDINSFVCGSVFNVSLQDICPPMEQPLRLSSIDVSMSGDEEVSISLQPVGQFSDLGAV